MIDHVGIPVSDYVRSKRFYQAVLAALGAELVMEVPADKTEDGYPACGFGRDGKPTFWIGGAVAMPGTPHFAFVVDTRAAVDAFHRTALAEGATDNGAPGVRPHYHPNYYAAFVLDRDGYNIEAVCHLPPEAKA